MQPPCEAACPAGVKIQDYISLIAQGRYLEAIAVIRERMPFPSVCGRLCYHPCEGECNRGLVDEPVAIMYLKRFAADYEFKMRPPLPAPPEVTKPERVAIIGAGLCGLTAAQDLAKMGYPVTLFEALPFPGGTLRWAMLPYRLPGQLVDWDVQHILALGVELKSDTTLGKDFSLGHLKAQGYKAIFIATGANKSRNSSRLSAEIIAEGALIFGTVWAVHAVGAGHQAAISIDRYLCGEPLAAADTIPIPVVRRDRAELQEKVLRGQIKLAARPEMPLWEPLETTLGFIEMESGYSEEVALREALRCLSCGAGAQCLEEKCSACLTCVRLCPYGAPTITLEGTVTMRLEQCLACGICAAECPAGAIFMKGYAVDEISRMIGEKAEAIKGDKPFIFLFTCSYHTTTREYKDFPENVIHINLPCIGRIRTIDLLKAFEHGAAGLGVVSCKGGECRYLKGDLRIKERVNYVKGMLKEIGFEESKIELFELDSLSDTEWLNIANLMLERVS